MWLTCCAAETLPRHQDLGQRPSLIAALPTVYVAAAIHQREALCSAANSAGIPRSTNLSLSMSGDQVGLSLEQQARRMWINERVHGCPYSLKTTGVRPPRLWPCLPNALLHQRMHMCMR